VSAGPDVTSLAREALAGAAPSVFWLDDPQRPAPQPAPTSDGGADLVVVDGGDTGLWTALLARERRPDRSATLLEAGLCGRTVADLGIDCGWQETGSGPSPPGRTSSRSCGCWPAR